MDSREESREIGDEAEVDTEVDECIRSGVGCEMEAAQWSVAGTPARMSKTNMCNCGLWLRRQSPRQMGHGHE